MRPQSRTLGLTEASVTPQSKKQGLSVVAACLWSSPQTTPDNPDQLQTLQTFQAPDTQDPPEPTDSKHPLDTDCTA